VDQHGDIQGLSRGTCGCHLQLENARGAAFDGRLTTLRDNRDPQSLEMQSSERLANALGEGEGGLRRARARTIDAMRARGSGRRYRALNPQEEEDEGWLPDVSDWW
jgi:hypothetical protein